MEIRVNNGEFSRVSFVNTDDNDIFELDGKLIDITSEDDTNKFITALENLKSDPDEISAFSLFPFLTAIKDTFSNRFIDKVIEAVKECHNNAVKQQVDNVDNIIKSTEDTLPVESQVDNLVNEFLNSVEFDYNDSIAIILKKFAQWIIKK